MGTVKRTKLANNSSGYTGRGWLNLDFPKLFIASNRHPNCFYPSIGFPECYFENVCGYKEVITENWVGHENITITMDSVSAPYSQSGDGRQGQIGDSGELRLERIWEVNRVA